MDDGFIDVGTLPYTPDLAGAPDVGSNNEFPDVEVALAASNTYRSAAYVALTTGGPFADVATSISSMLHDAQAELAASLASAEAPLAVGMDELALLDTLADTNAISSAVAASPAASVLPQPIDPPTGDALSPGVLFSADVVGPPDGALPSAVAVVPSSGRTGGTHGETDALSAHAACAALFQTPAMAGASSMMHASAASDTSPSAQAQVVSASAMHRSPLDSLDDLESGEHLPLPSSSSDASAMLAAAATQRASLPPFLREMCEDALRSVAGPEALARIECPSASTSTSSAASSSTGSASSIRICMAQLHSVAGDIIANVDRLRSMLVALRAAHIAGASDDARHSFDDGAPRTAADIVVLPETWLTGYHIGFTLMRKLALPLAGSCTSAEHELRLLKDAGVVEPSSTIHNAVNPLAAVASLAAEFGTAISLGFAEREGRDFDDADDIGCSAVGGASGGAAAAAGNATRTPDPIRAGAAIPRQPTVYNSLCLWDSDGRLAGHYRKTHLWGAEYEKVVFTPGPGLPLPSGRVFDSRAMMRGNVALPAPDHQLHSGKSDGGSQRYSIDAYYPSEHDEATSTSAMPAYNSNPYQAVTLRRFPSIPIGLLICFDLEFPEPSRILAVKGCKLIIASTAMGERDAFASRVYARARALENHVCVAFSNYPSAPVPEMTAAGAARPSASFQSSRPERVTGDRSHAHSHSRVPGPVAPDAEDVHYSGGTCVVGPDGDYLHCLPAYVFPLVAPEQKEAAVQAEHQSSGVDAGSGAVGRCGALAKRKIANLRNQSQPGCTSEWMDEAATSAVLRALETESSGASRSLLGPDEHVFIVSFDPTFNSYADDERRNPYLADRRLDLFGGLQTTSALAVASARNIS